MEARVYEGDYVELVSQKILPIRMCFTNNPYAQWREADNGTTPPVSILGALPYPLVQPGCRLIAFRFTSFNLTILNSVILGPNSCPCYRIESSAELTALRSLQGEIVSLIEWQATPFVEIKDRLSKQNVNTWLKISSDQR